MADGEAERPGVRLPILTQDRDTEELINAFRQGEGCQ